MSGPGVHVRRFFDAIRWPFAVLLSGLAAGILVAVPFWARSGAGNVQPELAVVSAALGGVLLIALGQLNASRTQRGLSETHLARVRLRGFAEVKDETSWPGLVAQDAFAMQGASAADTLPTAEFIIARTRSLAERDVLVLRWFASSAVLLGVMGTVYGLGDAIGHAVDAMRGAGSTELLMTSLSASLEPLRFSFACSFEAVATSVALTFARQLDQADTDLHFLALEQVLTARLRTDVFTDWRSSGDRMADEAIKFNSLGERVKDLSEQMNRATEQVLRDATEAIKKDLQSLPGEMVASIKGGLTEGSDQVLRSLARREADREERHVQLVEQMRGYTEQARAIAESLQHIAGAAEALTKAGVAASGAIKEAGTTAGDAITSAGTLASDALKQAGGDASGAIEGAGKHASTALKEAATSVQGAGEAATSAIKEAGTTARDAITSAGTLASDALKQAGGDASGAIEGAGKGAAGTLEGAGSSLAQIAKEAEALLPQMTKWQAQARLDAEHALTVFNSALASRMLKADEHFDAQAATLADKIASRASEANDALSAAQGVVLADFRAKAEEARTSWVSGAAAWQSASEPVKNFAEKVGDLSRVLTELLTALDKAERSSTVRIEKHALAVHSHWADAAGPLKVSLDRLTSPETLDSANKIAIAAAKMDALTKAAASLESVGAQVDAMAQHIRALHALDREEAVALQQAVSELAQVLRVNVGQDA